MDRDFCFGPIPREFVIQLLGHPHPVITNAIRERRDAPADLRVMAALLAT